jgi:acylphosphatase
MTEIRVKIKIFGRVQGVFFRQSTLEQAIKYNLYGYVRNILDGSVEAEFEGEKNNVNKILEWCKKGPSTASVKGIEIISKELCERKLYKSFLIESSL